MTAPQLGNDAAALRVTVLCGLAVVLEGYDLSSLGYVVPVLAEQWGLRPAAFTSALTAGNVGMFFGALICGWLGDRIGRKPVLVGCVAIFGAASLLTAYVGGTSSLTVARFVTGFGLGGGIPLCIALVSDFSSKERQPAMVIAMISGVVVGNLLAGIFAANLIGPFGWQSVFIVGGVLPLLMVPVLILMLPESRAFLATRAERAAHRTSALPSNRLAALFATSLAGATPLLWAINFLNLLTIYFVNSWLPVILRGMGVSSQVAIIATSMFHVGAIIAAFVSGPLAGRLGIERVLSVMLVVGAVCIFVTGVTLPTILVLGVLIVGFGFGTNGAQLGISALPGAIYPPAIRSTGAGWATGIGRLGNISGALLGGALLSAGWSAQQMLLILAAAPAMNAVLMAALRRARTPVSGPELQSV